MLKKFAKKHFDTRKIPCRIFTFGFGYELDSEMLSEISNAGSGAYNFIPTAAMVGTVFVNAISNIRTTFATNAKIKLAAPVLRILGHDSEKEAKLREKYVWCLRIPILSLTHSHHLHHITHIASLTHITHSLTSLTHSHSNTPT